MGCLGPSVDFVFGFAPQPNPPKKTILGFLPLFIAGFIVTYLGLLFFNWEAISKAGIVLQFFISVAMISVVMQALIYPSKAYDHLIHRQKRRIVKKIKSQALVITTEEGELMLEPAQVSCVWVEDHYLHIIYQDGNNWAESVVHGTLKDIAEKLRPYLIQVSRSALVNPKHSLEFSGDYLKQLGMDKGIKIPQSKLVEVGRQLKLRQASFNQED